MKSFFFILALILLNVTTLQAKSLGSYLGPQLGVSVGARDYVHLRTGLVLKCCDRGGSLYGNQTGPSAQLELTPYRFSLQPGFSFQWRYRKQGSWVVRPYYFYGKRYSGEKDSGGGVNASSPWGGFGIEFGQDYSQLLISWDF